MSCFSGLLRITLHMFPTSWTPKISSGGRSGNFIDFFFSRCPGCCIDVWLHIDSSLPTLKCIIVTFAQGLQKISTESSLFFKKK